MNLRNVGEYNIGLDIGTGSVGWAVTDINGELCYFKGKPTWGSRLFPSANTAVEARVHRGQRRRYNRRKWRINLLQELFAAEMNRIDPEFFIRLNQSHLFPEDRNADHQDYTWTLFNDPNFDEKAYFKRFPTVYHLRKWLMETSEKADIRLIYLAFHNIVKHRGNFLQQDNANLSSENVNVDRSVDEFCRQLQEYCDTLDIPCEVESKTYQITEILRDTHSSRSHLKEQIVKLLSIQPCDLVDKKSATKMNKALAAALVGHAAELADVFFITEDKPEDKKTKIYLSKDEDVEAFEEICPEWAQPLFDTMKNVYSSFILQEILSSCPGKTISINKVHDYEQYGNDLKLLKNLIKQYAPEKYDEFFRGEFYNPTELHPQKYVYDKSKAKGYTAYNEKKTSYEDFKKDVQNTLKAMAAIDDHRCQNMMERFQEERFLRRLKTSDNGAVPFQLNREEMDQIIEKQMQFYPFLKTEKDKLDSLVTFRIPYYVGPLTQKNARKDVKGNLRFAWSERIEGKEGEAIKPWNWEDIIDKDRSATNFIRRMTGTCTYLQGEPVLPKCSLLYEEYCVLNELNGAHFSQDGDRAYRFDYADRSDMINELFRNGKVSYKKVSDWMKQRNHSNVRVSGGQGENGFESKLGSYIFFAKDIFNVDEIPETYYPMIEEIILWNTIFEDRDILKDKLKRNYGDRLNDEQIKKIVKKRFTGWGRLSKKLLCDIKVNTDNGPHSIMDILREGNPNNPRPSQAMVFMEILHDEKLGFDEKIAGINRETALSETKLAIEELPGSPALRRSVNQALGIVEEITRIAGHAPSNIFIEVTREDSKEKRRTQKRFDRLKDALKKLKEESPEFWDSAVSEQLGEHQRQAASLDEKLTLYFMQGGKSLYSGTPLEIGRLFEYQVDHIIPQSYIKDDSFENKALVLASENQNKSDQMLLPADMRRKMRPYWDALLGAGLIGKKKHTNLLRDHIGEKQLKGFIARQLVETSQIMKLVQGFMSERYTGTSILPVKAGLSHELRERAGLVKCREINDFHHAHDALLAAEVGRFIQFRHPGMYDNPIGYTNVMRQFVKEESSGLRRGRIPGTSSFVISSFMTSGFDEKTGELFKDQWSASGEIEKLKRYFNYRQCYISRMPEETCGAFWDQTIYSPRDLSKNMTLPLKQNLDPNKYGSYSREQYAYFFIYKALKKNKEVLRFEPVPVSIASRINHRPSALDDYAKALAEEAELAFVETVRRKIYKYQLMEFNGSRLYLTGKKEARNAIQFAFNLHESLIAATMYEDAPMEESDLDELFLCVSSSLEKYSPKLFNALGISSWKDHYFELSIGDRSKILKELIAIGNGMTNVADLTLVGGAKYAGKIAPTYSKVLASDEGITFIDQSITGMFERRTHIGL